MHPLPALSVGPAFSGQAPASQHLRRRGVRIRQDWADQPDRSPDRL